MKFFVCLLGLAMTLFLTACEDEHEHHHHEGGAYYGPEYHGYGHGGNREFPEYRDYSDHY